MPRPLGQHGIATGRTIAIGISTLKPDHHRMWTLPINPLVSPAHSLAFESANLSP
jgi:hypothetical protein